MAVMAVIWASRVRGADVGGYFYGYYLEEIDDEYGGAGVGCEDGEGKPEGELFSDQAFYAGVFHAHITQGAEAAAVVGGVQELLECQDGKAADEEHYGGIGHACFHDEDAGAGIADFPAGSADEVVCAVIY